MQKSYSIKKWLIILAAISLLAILQTGLFSELSFRQSFTNLVLIFTIIVSLTTVLSEAVAVAIIGGIILDFYSGLADGVITLALIITAGLVYITVNMFISRDDTRFVLPVSVGAGTFVFTVITVMAVSILNWFGIRDDLNTGFIFGQKVWLDTLWNLLLTYPMFYFHQLVAYFINKKYVS